MRGELDRAVDKSPMLVNPVQDSLDLHPAVGLREWLASSTTILFDSTRDASFAAPRVWKLPDLWTQRTRPQVFAKPQTVSHSSHTPHRHIRFRSTTKTRTPGIIGHRPTDSAEEALFSALLAADAGYASALSPKEAGAQCRFTLAQAQLEPTLLVTDELAGHVRIMAQPDSPIAIIRADLRGIVLDAVGGSYSYRGDYTVEVKNMSDQPVTSVAVRLLVRKPDFTGGGAGRTLSALLPPGAVAAVKGRVGRGEGSDPANPRDPMLYVLISSVDFSGCTYEPAKTWSRPVRTHSVDK